MRRLTVIPVCFALAFAACGDDEEPEQPASTPPAAEETTSSGSGGGAQGGSTSVAIVDFEFDPKVAENAVGTTISWTNEDSADHNVIFDGDTPEDIDNLEQGQSGKVTFDEAGTFDYVCSYHPGMEGSVEIQ